MSNDQLLEHIDAIYKLLPDAIAIQSSLRYVGAGEIAEKIALARQKLAELKTKVSG
jgi:hypothetical protein